VGSSTRRTSYDRETPYQMIQRLRMQRAATLIGVDRSAQRR
jgi:hypothetical protein